jgi:ribosomal protein L30E
MVDQNVLARVVKEAIKSGKYVIGTKETVKNMKGMRAVILTESIPKKTLSKIEGEAKKNKVHLINSGLNSLELARIVGVPFRVSAIAMRGIAESEIKALEK